APSIDPSASPSGFSCVTTMKRSCDRSASTTSWSSRSVISGQVVYEVVDQLRHANPALDRRIVFERELRRSLQRELARDTRLDVTLRARKPFHRRLPLSLVAEDGHIDTSLAEVRRHIDSGHGDERDAGILHARQVFGDHCADELIDAAHALAHGLRLVM